MPVQCTSLNHVFRAQVGTAISDAGEIEKWIMLDSELDLTF